MCIALWWRSVIFIFRIMAGEWGVGGIMEWTVYLAFQKYLVCVVLTQEEKHIAAAPESPGGG